MPRKRKDAVDTAQTSHAEPVVQDNDEARNTTSKKTTARKPRKKELPAQPESPTTLEKPATKTRSRSTAATNTPSRTKPQSGASASSTDQMLIALEALLRRQESACAGDQSAAVADTLSTMAELLRYAGERTRAEAYYLRASEIRSRCFGKNSLTVAKTMQQLAILKEDDSCFSEAEKLYRWCVDTTIRKAGKEATEISFLIDRLKHVLEAQQKSSNDADRIVAASTNSAMNDPFDDFPWHYYSDYAQEALAAGALNRAEVMFNCLRDVALVLGPESVYLAQSLEFLSRLNLAKRRATPALKLHRKALAKYVEVLGLEHPEVGRCIGRLADLYMVIGDLGRARTAAQRAMDTLAAAADIPSDEVLYARQRLKKIVSAIATSQAADRTNTARRELEQITARVEVERVRLKALREDRLQGTPSSSRQPVDEDLIADDGKTDESATKLGAVDATPLMNCVDGNANNSGSITSSSIDPAISASDLLKESEDNLFQFLFEKYVAAGRRASETKNYVEAERMFLVAIEKARAFDTNDAQLWSTMCELADSYANNGKFYKATKLYQEVIDLCSTVHGSDSLEMVPLLCRLAHFYAVQGELIKERECHEQVLILYKAAGAAAYELAPHEERILTLRRELDGC